MNRRAGAALAVGVLVLVGACGSDDDGERSATTSVAESVPSPPPTAAPDRVEPVGFTTVTAQITESDGEVCEVCVWLADDQEERSRGLMGVTSLGDAVGMVFRFEEPIAGSFYMFQTPTPLSIAWFGGGGALVGSADMEPCLEVPAGGCPLYSPGVEYDLALEVFEGGLEPLGIGPGARLELVDGTEADRCPG